MDKHKDDYNTDLFYQLAAGKPYTPASYTSVRAFVETFPKKPKPEFVPDSLPTLVDIDSHRKSILSTL